MLEPLDAVVIGGGISGLTAAHALAKAGRRFALLEGSPRFGGCIGSVSSGPYLADMGPQTFQLTPSLRELVADLALDNEFVPAPRDLKRYIFRHGRLMAVPLSPLQFLASPLVSLGAKMRILREPFVRAAPPGDDESIASFVRRRAGDELLDALVEPFVSGVYAGDPERLSIRSAFPAIAELERTHGSVMRGFLARRYERRSTRAKLEENSTPGLSNERRSPGLLRPGGFVRGNQTLVDALLKTLGRHAYASAHVTALRQRGAFFMLECEGLPEKKVEAEHIILATSAAQAGDLVEPLEPGAAEDLRAIESPPLAQVVLAYPKAAIRVPLDGFGFLACRGEGVRLLGAVWNSTLFPRRCPPGEALMTAFLGGATDLGIAQCSDEEVARFAHRDLERIMRVSHPPHVVAGFRWSNAIPQYSLGHEQRVARIRAAINRIPNLSLVGNFLSGVSVSDCINLAQATAAKAVSRP